MLLQIVSHRTINTQPRLNKQQQASYFGFLCDYDVVCRVIVTPNVGRAARVRVRVARARNGHGGLHYCPYLLPIVLSKVWFVILKYIVFEAYPLLAPKCRVGASAQPQALQVAKITI
jgi:hypothetical protein